MSAVATRPVAPSVLVCSPDDRTDLAPAPIDPADVLAGDPVASCVTLSDAGHGCQTLLWDCTPGRFRWDFGRYDEVVHIVRGSVTVTDAAGGTALLQAGDVATFFAGSKVIWEVHEPLRKVAVVRALPGDPLSRLARTMRRQGARLVRRVRRVR